MTREEFYEALGGAYCDLSSEGIRFDMAQAIDYAIHQVIEEEMIQMYRNFYSQFYWWANKPMPRIIKDDS